VKDIAVDILTANEFAPLVGIAAQIYGEAMVRPPELVVQRREIVQSHLSRKGLVAVVASSTDDQVVGFGYGYRGRQGEWWHDIVAEALGRDASKQWLHGAFELAELHVRPNAQGQGVGRRILETVLAQVSESTVVLSTHDRESPARQLYRSLGFRDLLTGFVFPGSSEVYVIMGRPA
jgi:ribosomal protein S18 acetylase RimI-like enzyme